MRASRPTPESIHAKNEAFMSSTPTNDNSPSLLGMAKRLSESLEAQQQSLNELEAIMLQRGFITREGLAAARREMEAPNG